MVGKLRSFWFLKKTAVISVLSKSVCSSNLSLKCAGQFLSRMAELSDNNNGGATSMETDDVTQAAGAGEDKGCEPPSSSTVADVELEVPTSTTITTVPPATPTKRVGADGFDAKITQVREGKVVLEYGATPNIFYNPIQEVNRDISILGIETHRRQQKKETYTILEAMAASGIRSIRYAKELSNVTKVIANDFSKEAVQSIEQNTKLNQVEESVQSSFMDASVLMHSQRYTHFVVDVDPYGTPIPFLDAAVQCVEDGGLLLATATDMAILAGNTPETCFAKYGAMSLKSDACHEFALRILIHSVQSFANRYGRYAEPLLSLKIDFYIRIFFKITKSPKKCKETVLNTSMIFQCTGCRSLNFQPLCTKKENRFHFAQGPNVGQKCEFCDSKQHIGGPIWSGEIHNKEFVESMLVTLKEYSYLNTAKRIEGLLYLASEEVPTPALYSISQLCSVLKSPVIPLVQLRSALLNDGYLVSSSHTEPGTLKTNGPNQFIWEILVAYARKSAKCNLAEHSAGFKIMEKFRDSNNVDFKAHPKADNPKGILRYQMNPTRGWGPGMKATVNRTGNDNETDKKILNQNKKRRKLDAAAEENKTK